MALWQWDTWLVPEKAIEEKFKGKPDLINLADFEEISWWDNVSEADLVDFFDTVLPDYPTPWTKYSRSWGSDDGDRATLMVEKGGLTDVIIRVDLRDLNMDFLESLVNFARLNHFQFFPVESCKFIEPGLSELLFEIRSSRKCLFVSNPKKFFEDKEYLDKIEKENRKKLRELSQEQ